MLGWWVSEWVQDPSNNLPPFAEHPIVISISDLRMSSISIFSIVVQCSCIFFIGLPTNGERLWAAAPPPQPEPAHAPTLPTIVVNVVNVPRVGQSHQKNTKVHLCFQCAAACRRTPPEGGGGRRCLPISSHSLLLLGSCRGENTKKAEMVAGWNLNYMPGVCGVTTY